MCCVVQGSAHEEEHNADEFFMRAALLQAKEVFYI